MSLDWIVVNYNLWDKNLLLLNEIQETQKNTRGQQH